MVVMVTAAHQSPSSAPSRYAFGKSPPSWLRSTSQITCPPIMITRRTSIRRLMVSDDCSIMIVVANGWAWVAATDAARRVQPHAHKARWRQNCQPPVLRPCQAPTEDAAAPGRPVHGEHIRQINARGPRAQRLVGLQQQMRLCACMQSMRGSIIAKARLTPATCTLLSAR